METFTNEDIGSITYNLKVLGTPEVNNVNISYDIESDEKWTDDDKVG